MLKKALFVSDIHLSAHDADTAASFFSFLAEVAPQAQALFILGDLFDAWVGDDDLADPFNLDVARRLAALSIPVYLLHGNRDFLLGDGFLAASRATLLPDPSLVDIGGKPALLSHGDIFCTADSDYGEFRAQVRNPAWQAKFLAQPLSARRDYAEKLRAMSESGKQQKSSELMDVVDVEVEKFLRQNGYPRLVHGHTHLPAVHIHQVDGRQCERWVLGDWHPDGAEYLCIDGENAQIRHFPNR